MKKWDLDRDVQLNTRVVGAYWQEEEGLWRVEVESDGKRRVEFSEILISGQGFLKYVHSVSFALAVLTHNFHSNCRV